MHFNIKKQMLEVCFLHTPTFIIEPILNCTNTAVPGLFLSFVFIWSNGISICFNIRGIVIDDYKKELE